VLAVPVVIVLASVIPSVSVVVFIVARCRRVRSSSYCLLRHRIARCRRRRWHLRVRLLSSCKPSPCRSSLSSCQCCPLQLSWCLSSEGSVNALKWTHKCAHQIAQYLGWGGVCHALRSGHQNLG
jgi:hypothetical protein